MNRDRVNPHGAPTGSNHPGGLCRIWSGDIDGYLQACADGFAFHVPGHCAIAGAYIGRQGIYDLAGKAMEITGGTFHEEVEDVLANDSHAVVLARHQFTRNGIPKDYRTAHVYDIGAGKLARCFEQPRDPASFDDAWGSLQASSRTQDA